jgi:dolichol-phosphate mannosyltransferase
LRLSVLIPVYNEADSVAEVVRRVAAVELPLEILVVDDGSTDASSRRLSELEVPCLRVIRHEVNRGKGAAVRTALAAATGDAVVIQDADLEYFPEDFPTLIAPLADGRADAVYGVRDLTGQPIARRLGNHLLTLATNLLFGVRLRDMETCYKMIRLPVARSLALQADRFDIEPEITALLLRGGHAIVEVPIRYAPRAKRSTRALDARAPSVPKLTFEPSWLPTLTCLNLWATFCARRRPCRRLTTSRG